LHFFSIFDLIFFFFEEKRIFFVTISFFFSLKNKLENDRQIDFFILFEMFVKNETETETEKK